MKKFLLLALMLLPSALMAQTGAVTGFCNNGASQAAVSGLQSTNYQQGIIPSCSVTVYLTGTTTLATIYADKNSTPLANPFTASATGQWIFFAVPSAGYDVTLSGGIAPNTYPSPVTITAVYASQQVITVPGAAGANTQAQYNNNGVLAGSLATLDAAGNFNTPANISAGTISLSLPGADPTGVADNSSIVNAAIAAQIPTVFATSTCLSLPAGKYYVPTLSNTYGVCLTGPGVLLKSISQTETGGAPFTTKGMQNSYAYGVPRLYFGQEYLGHWVQMAQSNAASVTATINTTCSGDSTTVGTNTSGGFDPCALFFTVAGNANVQGMATPTNAGHSGKDSADWLSTYLATDLAGNPDVYFIRWGINDALFGITPAQTIANIRAGLAQIRPVSECPTGATCTGTKTVDQMTVVLELPSSTNDNPSGRSPIFYEQLRNGFAQAARDFHAAFIDNYGALPDNDFAVQTCMMDLPYASSGTPPIHIHPGNCKAIFYADLISKLMIDPLRNIYGAAGVTNIPSATYQPLDTAFPSTYPYGVSIYRANLGSWPLNGQVVTFKGKDGSDVIQFNNQYNGSSSLFYFRTGNNASIWNAWNSVGGALTGAVNTGSTATTGMQLGTAGTTPDVVWTNSSAPLDQKQMDCFITNGGSFECRLMSDTGGGGGSSIWLNLVRGGFSPVTLTLSVPVIANDFRNLNGVLLPSAATGDYGPLAGKVFLVSSLTATPTIGAAAGTGATVACATSYTCDGIQGALTLVTGTGPTTGTLFTMALGYTRTNFANCEVKVILPGTGQITTVENSGSATGFTETADSALTASTTYTVRYHCFGQ